MHRKMSCDTSLSTSIFRENISRIEVLVYYPCQSKSCYHCRWRKKSVLTNVIYCKRYNTSAVWEIVHWNLSHLEMKSQIYNTCYTKYICKKILICDIKMTFDKFSFLQGTAYTWSIMNDERVGKNFHEKFLRNYEW